MQFEDISKFLLEQKRKGMSEDEILGRLFRMFKEGYLDVNQLNQLVQILGYELSEEFLNMSTEEQKNSVRVDENDDAKENNN